MTIHNLINLGIKKLVTSPSAALDAEVLLSFFLGKSKEFLLINPHKRVDPKIEKKFLTAINRRLLGWPVAYLIKEKEFYKHKFYVDKHVLIPRPETEGLVELVIKHIKSIKSNKLLNILDIGTGSGNIIVTLAKQIRTLNPVPHTLFFASDISPKAIAVAKKNAKFSKVKIKFADGNLLEPWGDQKFDVIVANLPYLAKLVDPSTRHEPIGALVAAKKGLKLYEELFKQIRSRFVTPAKTGIQNTGSPIKSVMTPSAIFVEIGRDQGRAITKLAKKLLPTYRTKIHKDLFGRTRYAVITI
jgi:release factor glutamine methyltransferase